LTHFTGAKEPSLMSCTPALSQRARDDAAPLISYYEQLLQAWGDAFHPTDNPTGFKIMAVAENKLMWPMLKARLARQPPLDAATGYTSSAGCEAIRTALAAFMSRDIFSNTLADPSHFVVSGGVGPVHPLLSPPSISRAFFPPLFTPSQVLNNLIFAIADAGDAIIVPAPYYLGFDMDTRVRASVTIFPAHRSPPSFILTSEALSAAAAQARAAGKAVRALLISSPDNPTGRLLLPEEIQLAAQFARENSLHFICDEIYAKSIFAGGDASAFVSSADCAREDLDSGRLHILYAKSAAVDGHVVTLRSVTV
jgi:hypothetical protein